MIHYSKTLFGGTGDTLCGKCIWDLSKVGENCVADISTATCKKCLELYKEE